MWEVCWNFEIDLNLSVNEPLGMDADTEEGKRAEHRAHGDTSLSLG